MTYAPTDEEKGRETGTVCLAAWSCHIKHPHCVFFTLLQAMPH